MFINTFTKEFTLVSNAIPSHDIAFEDLLCYKMVANVYYELDNIKLKCFKMYNIYR